jgi:hypothetical protein
LSNHYSADYRASFLKKEAERPAPFSIYEKVEDQADPFSPSVRVSNITRYETVKAVRAG